MQIRSQNNKTMGNKTMCNLARKKRSMPTCWQTSRRQKYWAAAAGFTLVELLVVIAIIGVLAALAIGGVTAAMEAGRRTAIKMEISGLNTEYENYRTEKRAYPPNCMVGNAATYGANATPAKVLNDLKRHFNSVHPKHRIPKYVFAAMLGDDSHNLVAHSLAGGMNGAEALVFWMSGFSKDPKSPLIGPGGPAYKAAGADPVEERNWGYEFKITQLGPRVDEDLNVGERYIEFKLSSANGAPSYRINFYTYQSSIATTTEPFVYFDASRHLPKLYDVPLDGPGGNLFAPKRRNESKTKIVFANKGKCQILHTGTDGEWGEGFFDFKYLTNQDPKLLIGEGPFVEDVADTLSNFLGGMFKDSVE